MDFESTKLEELDTTAGELFISLIKTNIAGKPEKAEILVEKLMLSNGYVNCHNYFVGRNYGYLGVKELRFCYDYVTKTGYSVYINREVKKMLLNYCKLPAEGIGYRKYLNAVLSRMNKRAGKLFLLEYAQEKFPGLTESLIQKYVRIRKVTDYQVDMDVSNDEIVNAYYEKTGELVSWDTINHLKRIFGYKEEPEVSDNYKLKKASIKAKKAEQSADLEFFAEAAGTKTISASQLKKTLEKLQNLDMDSQDIKILQTWFTSVKKGDRIPIRPKRVTAGMVRKYGSATGTDILKAFLKEVSEDSTMPEILIRMASVGLITLNTQ